MTDVRVRFAPSPSGDLHVGNVRTALYDWAFARSTGGTFVLRIEDTDRTRVTPEYIGSAQDTLRWLGLDWDEGPAVGGPFGPYLQSERMDIYAEWVDRFLKDGHAYHCYCSQEELAERRQAARKAGGPSGYDGHCRDLTPGQVAAYQAEGRQPVVRFKMPPGSTTFTDLVRGEVTFDHAHVPDFTLTRADGTPLYTLAVAVNDVLMKITHVVRGEDLLSSTPRQIAVYRAMGVEEAQFPVFAHLPYVLGKDGQRLSKRNGVVSVNWYREQGFLPEAICNYLALLGWSPGENREEFTMAEMAAEFDLARVNKNAAQFDVRKLEAINGDKIRALDPADFAARITPFLAGDGLVATPPTAAESRADRGRRPARPGAGSHARPGGRDARFPVRRRGRFPRRSGGRGAGAHARRGAGAGGRGGGAGRARALDRGSHQGGAGDRSGGGAGPQAAGGVRRGGAGRDHRTAREPAAVRVDRAAGPRPYAGPPGPGAGYRRWWR